MVNNPQSSIENSFTGGLKTEFTGLNFPENACTEASNCFFGIVGDVQRRGGINYETNHVLNTQSTAGKAINTYKWNNVGGDGTTQIIVTQTGGTLEFYLATNATINNPLSTQLLSTTIDVSAFLATNAILAFDPTIECQFSDGNGYLFVFNSQCDPIYVTYNSGNQTVTPNRINIQIRDFAGVPDGLDLKTRPTTLSPEHAYNLDNQGWGTNWSVTSTTLNTIGTGSFTFTVSSATAPIVVGSTVTASAKSGFTTGSITGTVTSYSGFILVISEVSNTGSGTFGGAAIWTIVPAPNYVSLWFASLSNYPANCDVWWYYRNTNVTSNNPDGTFTPNLAKTGYILPTNSQAPQGAILLNAFIQQRSALTGIVGLTDVTTTARPSNGCFFQGRVFYAGASGNFQPSGDEPFYTWTENIYFSQIFTNNPNLIGYCYQQNDPTSSTLFNLLPSDGGVINIQGAGEIYKLFPIQSGIIVFAANGIWYITGSSSIGFTANDYTIVKISSIQSISSTSFVDVLGWPLFWNEEGIYQVGLAQQGGSVRSPDIRLDVKNLCLGTILSFYNEIPLQSKKYARGAYDPISYVVQWIYRSANELNITSRYQFDSVLNINTYKGPFYPYSISNDSSHPYISGIVYVAGPGGSTSPDPIIKYFTVVNNTQTTWSEENDFTTYSDWGLDFTSSFTTGYKLHGSAWKLWQLGYVYMFSDNSQNTQYKIRGLWDYGISGASGKWSATQLITNNKPYFGNIFRKIRIRGRGLALQLQVTSLTGVPFNISGWSMWENINASI